MAGPTYVYKIMPAPPPSPLPDVFPLSDLDRTDGFIHLSTAHQIPTTSRLFFAEAVHLWLLKIPLEAVQVGIKWPDELPGCAHLYGGFLGRSNVEDVKAFERPAGEDWAAVFGKDPWMVQ